MVVSQRVKLSYVVIETERCKGCRFCTHVCPKQIISLTPHINRLGYTPAVITPEKAEECTGCTACAIMCPDAAISVYRRNGQQLSRPRNR